MKKFNDPFKTFISDLFDMGTGERVLTGWAKVALVVLGVVFLAMAFLAAFGLLTQ